MDRSAQAASPLLLRRIPQTKGKLIRGPGLKAAPTDDANTATDFGPMKLPRWCDASARRLKLSQKIWHSQLHPQFSPQNFRRTLMHARMIQVTTKPGQLKEFVKTMLEKNLSILKQQPGFVDAMALTSDTERDQFVGVAIWKSKEDAEKYADGQGRQVLELVKPLLQQEPTIRTFNLEASTIHNIGIGRAGSSG